MIPDFFPRSISLYTLIIALLVINFATYGYAAETDSQHPSAILIIGDSLSAAYGIEPQQGWVNLLRQRLKAKHTDIQIVNASITGDTTSGGLARLPQALERHQPSIVIIELGANDGLRGFNPKRIRHNLVKMVRLIQQQQAEVLLVGVRIPSNYGRAFTQRFESVFPAVAEETGIPLVQRILEGVAERPELFQDDGIHPTAEAQIMMLNNIWPQLEPLLEP